MSRGSFRIIFAYTHCSSLLTVFAAAAAGLNCNSGAHSLQGMTSDGAGAVIGIEGKKGEEAPSCYTLNVQFRAAAVCFHAVLALGVLNSGVT